MTFCPCYPGVDLRRTSDFCWCCVRSAPPIPGALRRSSSTWIPVTEPAGQVNLAHAANADHVQRWMWRAASSCLLVNWASFNGSLTHARISHGPTRIGTDMDIVAVESVLGDNVRVQVSRENGGFFLSVKARTSTSDCRSASCTSCSTAVNSPTSCSGAEVHQPGPDKRLHRGQYAHRIPTKLVAGVGVVQSAVGHVCPLSQKPRRATRATSREQGQGAQLHLSLLFPHGKAKNVGGGTYYLLHRHTTEGGAYGVFA
jgi:hypothetical protein